MLTPLIAAFALQTAPLCEGGHFDDFDFWIGDWEVYQNDKLAGRNTITKEERGCLVLEKWTGAGGSSGQSYNYYDPAKKAWRQVWVSPGFLIDYEGGLDREGRMALEGTLTLFSGAPQQRFRGLWTPKKNGHVQQTFWTWSEEEQAWQVWFDAEYRPASS